MTRAWTSFTLQTVPFFILAMVSMFVGFQFSSRGSGSNLLIATLIGLLLFAALMTFKKAHAWNAILLLSFALVLGFVIAGFLPPEYRSEGPVVALRTLILLIVAALAGRLLGQRSVYFGISLWVASWIHVIGWGIVLVTELPFTFIRIWGAMGLFIFMGLSIVWFGRLEDHQEESAGPSQAIDLFFLSINLGIVIFILTGSSGP